MRVFRTIAGALAGRTSRAAVVTPGFFDGLHRGHQALLAELKSWAAAIGADPAVLTFDPHPGAIVSGRCPPAVFSLDHRLMLLEREGVATTLVLPFDADVAAWSPQEFITRVLREALDSRHLLLGFDSTIGHRRQGTYEYLSARSARLDVEVRQSGRFVLDGTRVSSTLVRLAVHEGDLGRIRELTGRDYSILGRVVHGDHRGRTIGFPTANLQIESESVAPGGVYFAHADLVTPPGSPARDRGESRRMQDVPALVNIGRRPTFTSTASTTTPTGLERFDAARDRIEVHVLDFNGDLYDTHLEVRLLQRHRDERKFDRVDDLVGQIREDEKALRAWLAGTE